METEPNQVLLAEANEKYAAGALSEALALYIEVLETEPESAWAHSRIGAIHAQLGEAEQAEAALLRALEIDPDLPQAHSNLGNIFFARGEFINAAERYQKARSLDPDSPVYYTNLHAAYKKMGKMGEAISALKQAHKLERSMAREEARNVVGRMRTPSGRKIGCAVLTILLLIGILLSVLTWL